MSGKAIIYVRKSTDREDKQKLSIEGQLWSQRRCFKRFFHTPTSSQSSINTRWIYSYFNSPVLHVFCDSLISNKICPPSVSSLFSPSWPATIFFEVSFFIIDPIEGKQKRRTSSHIRKEWLKRVFPLITHLYTSSSVIFIFFTILVTTSRFYLLPYTISSSLGHIMFGGFLSRYTSARSRISLPQIFISDFTYFSTVTKALVHYVRVFSINPTRNFSNNGQFSKSCIW